MKSSPLHTSTRRFRALKQQHFHKALEALRKLDQGSLRLPTEVCGSIWKGVSEIQKAHENWMVQYHCIVQNHLKKKNRK
jgi:hypothetical protein